MEEATTFRVSLQNVTVECTGSRVVSAGPDRYIYYVPIQYAAVIISLSMNMSNFTQKNPFGGIGLNMEKRQSETILLGYLKTYGKIGNIIL